MVKNSRKLNKPGKSEENVEVEDDTPVEASTEDPSIVENADGDSKKKGKAKPTKKEEQSEENGDDIKENGADPPVEKKKAAPKKEKAIKKTTVEPERKSSRQPKPVLKENDQNEKSQPKRGQKRNASKSPARSKKPKATKEEKDYEVEEVVGVRTKKGKKEYKIRWKGYKPSQDTWEPEKHLSCQDLIEKYLEENKDKETGSKPKTPVKRSKSATKSAKKSKAK